MNKETIIVNFFGGPGVGKSTMAAGLFYELKKRNINTEMLREFAKEKVIEKNFTAMDFQPYISGHQTYAQELAKREFDVVVTDSPILLGVFYDMEENEVVKSMYKDFLVEKFKDYRNVNFFLKRTFEYEHKGRRHDIKESKKIDQQLIDLLKKHDIPFTIIESSDEDLASVINEVLMEYEDYNELSFESLKYEISFDAINSTYKAIIKLRSKNVEIYADNINDIIPKIKEKLVTLNKIQDVRFQESPFNSLLSDIVEINAVNGIRRKGDIIKNDDIDVEIQHPIKNELDLPVATLRNVIETKNIQETEEGKQYLKNEMLLRDKQLNPFNTSEHDTGSSYTGASGVSKCCKPDDQNISSDDITEYDVNTSEIVGALENAVGNDFYKRAFENIEARFQNGDLDAPSNEKGLEHDKVQEIQKKLVDMNKAQSSTSTNNEYDSEGFNAKGYDINGVNDDGYDTNGFDDKGFDINGKINPRYAPFGYDVDGFNILGFDKSGFDIDGKDDEGFGRDGKRQVAGMFGHDSKTEYKKDFSRKNC